MHRLALLAASSLLSLSFTLPTLAHAKQPLHTPSQAQKHLSTYRNDTDALMTLKIDWQTWKNLFDEAMADVKTKATVEKTEASSGDDASDETTETETITVEDSDDLLKMFNSFNQEIKAETGIDLFWDVLLNLGTHLSMGYRAFPNRAGDVLVQLDVRSGAQAKSVLDKLYTHLQKDTDSTQLIKEAFGPQTLYTFVLDEDEEVYQRLNIAVHENTLIMTVGPDAHQLKTMLYMGQVLPKDSNFRLTNTAYFKPVEKTLESHPLWLYSDLQGLMELAELAKDELELESSDIDVLAELIPLVRGLGLGVDYKQKQLIFHGMAAHDQANLSDFQKKYLAALKAPSESKSSLKKHLLGPSPLVLLGEKLDLSLSQPYPIDPDKLAKSANLSVLNEMSYRELFPKFSGLDLDKDILPYLDGNYGFSVVELPGKEVPQSVLVLGLKEGQGNAFATALQKNLNIDLKELLSDEEIAPIRLVPHGEHQGASLYRFSGPLEDMGDLKEALFPVAAQKDDVWILGQTEAAVKAALDGQAVGTPALKTWMHKTDTRQAANVFFMDVSQLLGWATRYGIFGKDDEDIQSIAKAWKSIYSATYPTAEGFEGKVVFDIDFGALPLDKLGEALASEMGEGFDLEIDVEEEEATEAVEDDTEMDAEEATEASEDDTEMDAEETDTDELMSED